MIAQQQLLFYIHETFIIFLQRTKSQLLLYIQKINNQNIAKQPSTDDNWYKFVPIIGTNWYKFVPIMHILYTYKTIKSF